MTRSASLRSTRLRFVGELEADAAVHLGQPDSPRKSGGKSQEQRLVRVGTGSSWFGFASRQIPQCEILQPWVRGRIFYGIKVLLKWYLSAAFDSTP